MKAPELPRAVLAPKTLDDLATAGVLVDEGRAVVNDIVDDDVERNLHVWSSDT